eukprot:scaffold101936_cov69-Phaeocystis_antarctica.AAC.1
MRSRIRTSRSTHPPCGVAASPLRRTRSRCRLCGFWTTSTTSTARRTCCRARSSGLSTSASGSATPRGRPLQYARNNTHAVYLARAIYMPHTCHTHTICMQHACHMHALHARLGPGPCRRPLPRPLRHRACGRRGARLRLSLAFLLLRTLALVAAARAALRVCAQLRQAAAPVRACAGGPPRAAPAPSTIPAGQARPRCAPAPAHKAPARR